MNKIIVEIKNEQNFYRPDKIKIKDIIKYILKSEGCFKTEVSILLTDNKGIRRLNKKYRKVNKATDVLAFYQENDRGRALMADILGDIVISVETAEKRAKEYKRKTSKEVYLYLVHGLLHLLNYRDETLRDYRTMSEKQEKLFNEICKRGL